MNWRGTELDPRPPRPPASDRALLVLVMLTLVIGAVAIYARVLAFLLERVAAVLGS